MNDLNVDNIAEVVEMIKGGRKPAPIDEEYDLFAKGKYEKKSYNRKRPAYGLQIEVDKLRLQANFLDVDNKDVIARRHGWGKYDDDGTTKYGQGYIDDLYSEIEITKRLLKIVSNCPDDFNLDHLDTGEADRLIGDFLLSCRA